MRQELKILAGVGVIAVGVGAWYIGSRYALGSRKAATETTHVTPPSPVADASTTGVVKDETVPAGPTRATPASSSEVGSGAVASPPPPAGIHEQEQRSFRPPSIGATEQPAAGLPPEPVREPAVTPAQIVETPLTPTPTAEDTVTLAPARTPVSPAPVTAAPRTPAIELAPASRPADAGKKTGAQTTEHVIQPGETYSSLAAKYLGSERYASLIAKANPGKDPKRLFVGAKIKIPAAPPATATRPSIADLKAPSKALEKAVPGMSAEAAPPIPEGHAYKVQEREGWYDLARRFLGDGNRWPELYELNKERVTRDPNGLRAGTMIEVPKLVTTKPS